MLASEIRTRMIEMRLLPLCNEDIELYQCALCNFSTNFLVEFAKHRKECNANDRIEKLCPSLDNQWEYQNSEDYLVTLTPDFFDDNIRKISDEPESAIQEYILEDGNGGKECQNINTNGSSKIEGDFHTPTNFDDHSWLKCLKCGLRTRKEKVLSNHTCVLLPLINHLIWSQCEYCTYKTKYKDILANHMMNMHRTKLLMEMKEKGSARKSRKCPRINKWKYQLLNHLMRVYKKDKAICRTNRSTL